MDRLRFGTAGIPISTSPRDTGNGIKQVRKLGLENMELEFVYSVNITPEKAPEIKRIAKENDVILTCHGQYYINLNAQEKEKIDASIQRVIKAAKITHMCGGWSVCFHAAHYMGDIIGAYHNVKNSLKQIMKKLKNDGIDIWVRPETGGRLTQFGSLEELIKVCQDVEGVLPCIDFAHHYSRSLGDVNKLEDFRNILEELEKGLGRHILDNMHIHTEGIEFGTNGEKNHLPLQESKFNYKDLVKVWKEFNIKGVVVCESPIIEEDALLLKKVYNSIST